jgi:hypothetical protein
MVDDTVAGLLRIIGGTVLAIVVLGSVLYMHPIASLSVRFARWLRILPRPAPTPLGLPIERIARDLRRLEPEARRHRQGTPVAKHRGVVAAYDDVLLEACRAVNVETTLDALPEGIERESERLRVEYELERAGIPIRSAS